MKIVNRALVVLFAVAVVLVVGAAGWLWTSLPNTDGDVTIAKGLDAPVDIVRDTHGVPHIFADSAADAWFALGYVHAQDRLWQMEGMRRTGAGRLSEVIGERGLRSDRFMRTLGLNRLVEAQWQSFDAATRAPMQAYATGVNAWIDGHAGSLPPEFLVLRHTPEAWKPTDSLLWARLMGLRLSSNWRSEAFRARLLKTLPSEQVRELWPVAPPDGSATVAANLDEILPDLDGLAAALPDSPWLGDGASNAWAVAGSGTNTGKPILANDPHLGFDAPILWYLARIETPNLTLTGATVPGVPLLVLGHNGNIAWGLTTTHSDTEDLFIERLSKDEPDSYDTPVGPWPFIQREERIAVRDSDDVIVAVRETRHGPVISDLTTRNEDMPATGTVLVLSATFLRPDDTTPAAFQHLNRATDVDAARAAMSGFLAPQQNLMVADTAGNIAFMVAGLTPIRAAGSGFAPAPGWSGEADWTGYIPYDALPHSRNPVAGRLINANNRVAGPDNPHFLGNDWAPPYRAQRIAEQLSAETPHSLDAAARLQSDSVSLMAGDFMTVLGNTPAIGNGPRRALAMLKAWDGSFAIDRPEPLIFMTWMREFTRRLFVDELGEAFPQFFDIRPLLLGDVLKHQTHWCDDIRTLQTESCDGLAAAALTKSVAILTGEYIRDMALWRWGDAHQAQFDHPVLHGIPILGGMANLDIESPGGPATVNRGSVSIDNDAAPFAHVHGAGFRGIYDLGDLARSRFMIATGQSGNPLSAHYGDFLEAWRDGDYLELGTARADLESTAEGILNLVPAAR